MPTRRGGTHLRHSSTAKDTSGKYASAAYPQWMRILEDKYQKLHQKIALASRLNSVRSERNPRTVRDGAASRNNMASASVRFISNVDISNSDKNLSTSAHHTAGDATAAVDKNIESDVVAVTADAELVKNGSKFQTQTKCDSKFQTETKCDFKFQTETKCDSKFQTGLKCSRFEDEIKDGITFRLALGNDDKHQHMLKDCTKFHDELNNYKFQKELEDCSNFRILTTSLSEGHETERMSRFTKTDNRERKVFSRYPPNMFNVSVNTATSRDSHHTARSCPAIIQTLIQMGAPPRVSVITNHHRGPLVLKSLNMFSKMSSEAQHAVSETLIEMGAERSNSVTTTSSSALDVGMVVKVNETPRERPFPSRNSKLLNTLAQRRRGLGTGTIRRECQHLQQRVASNTSTCSSNSSERLQRTCLPPLIKAGFGSRAPIGGMCCVENITAARLRIPALCKYDVEVFREPTFQITLPDFDIRYRDVLSSERCDSETPPLEIREEAIKKCQAWLAKYTNR